MNLRPQETKSVSDHSPGATQSHDAYFLPAQLIRLMSPLFPAETMQQTDQLANDILHDSLIAIVADTQDRYPPLTCGGYIHIRARLAIEGTAHPDVFDIRASLDHVPPDLCIIRDEHTICVPDPVHNLLIRFRNASIKNNLFSKLLQTLHSPCIQPGRIYHYNFLKHILLY